MKKNHRIVSVQTQYGRYQCVLEPDEKRGFIVTVPGLAGVITWGKNISQAKAMAREAIELCVECRAEEALQRPKTKSQNSARKLLPV